MVSSEVIIERGTVAQTERWPFATLKRGHYFQEDDLALHTALRSASTRAKKRYPKKNFSVRKVTLTEGGERRQVLRVFRIPRRGHLTDTEA